MTGGGFVAKILKQTALVYDLRWDDGVHQPMYIIFEADKAKHSSFSEKLNGSDSFNLKEFGTILYSGLGEPDDALKDELRQKYGMYEND